MASNRRKQAGHPKTDRSRANKTSKNIRASSSTNRRSLRRSRQIKDHGRDHYHPRSPGNDPADYQTRAGQEGPETQQKGAVKQPSSIQNYWTSARFMFALVCFLAVTICAFLLLSHHLPCTTRCDFSDLDTSVSSPEAPDGVSTRSTDNITFDCNPVHGKVLSEVKPRTVITLHHVPDTDIDTVLPIVKRELNALKADKSARNKTSGNGINESLQITTVPVTVTEKGTQLFTVPCVAPGTYALAIPGDRYLDAFGAARPCEFDYNGFSLRLEWQGGDNSVMLAVFNLTYDASSETGQAESAG